MKTPDEQIRDVFQKLKSLIKKHESLLKENARLRNELNISQKSGEEREHTIARLTTEIGILKSSANLLEGNEKAAFEKQINHYIKTVDKCISILNK